jgi:hypothetical protein
VLGERTTRLRMRISEAQALTSASAIWKCHQRAGSCVPPVREWRRPNGLLNLLPIHTRAVSHPTRLLRQSGCTIDQPSGRARGFPILRGQVKRGDYGTPAVGLGIIDVYSGLWFSLVQRNVLVDGPHFSRRRGIFPNRAIVSPASSRLLKNWVQ